MEINIPTSFIKAGENVKQGDVIKLLTEGEYKDITGQDGKIKKVLQFSVELEDGEEKTYTMNTTTQKNLISEWGKDSKNWIGKDLKVWLLRQMSFGKLISVLILTPAHWDSPEITKEVDIPIINEEESWKQIPGEN